jgi:nucleoid-associated protein YgaU
MFGSALTSNARSANIARMDRTYVRRRRAASVVVAAVVAVLLSPLAASAIRLGAPEPAPAQRTVVVQPGDTLWSIAQRARPDDDPRETVATIEAVNGIGAGALEPGRSIVVPAA